jgi:hypothetical protein
VGFRQIEKVNAKVFQRIGGRGALIQIRIQAPKIDIPRDRRRLPPPHARS